MSEFSAGQAQALGSAIGGVGQLAGGIVGAFRQKDLEQRTQKELEAAQQNLADLQAAQPSLATPSAFYQQVQQAYDQRLMQQRLEDINRSLATTTQAVSQFGARGLGALAQATQQAQTAQRQEVLTQQRLQTQALRDLGLAEDRTIARQEARSTRNIEFGLDAQRLAEARVAQAEQQRIQNFANIAGGIGGIVGGVIGVGMGKGEKGMKVAKRGYKVAKTPGSFSHKTNPLTLVDKEGDSVGIELTGGEYVFNPEQSRKLLRLAKQGDSPLHKFLLKLLMKFEKDV
tara:strand:- start:1550 stop:2407 length:858 start_codon:yes stop_codon:yes gene_type:complete